MASKVIYTDDLEEGVEADAGTIQFALEGTTYEIDLSKKNATKLRSVLGPFIAAARVAKVKGSIGGGKGKGAPASGYNSEQLAAIREWAGRNGYTVSPKGRVPREVLEAFEKATASPAPSVQSVAANA